MLARDDLELQRSLTGKGILHAPGATPEREPALDEADAGVTRPVPRARPGSSAPSTAPALRASRRGGVTP